MMRLIGLGIASLFLSMAAGAQAPAPVKAQMQWGVKIPLRDGVRLNATLYRPENQSDPRPCLFTLTPYIAQSYHDRGVYFANHGYPFLTVDVRGRGNSEGEFRPLIQEAQDGHDIVEWLARQPYCNGKISMWGGSYAGYDQWVTAKEFPPHLSTIVPVASPYAGVDFPMRGNIMQPYLVQWLTLVSGHTSQDKIFGDMAFWVQVNQQWFESGRPLRELDRIAGNPLPTFQEWLSHPYLGAHWDSYNPTSEQYAKLQIPILTITGSYDDDQPGALKHYTEYMKHADAAGRARHYLVIGPWDHGGTRTPQAEFSGLKFGPASLVDLPQLHLDWYGWTMGTGPRPAFLENAVAYYVMGAEKWRYADSLAAVTGESRRYALDSMSNATDVLASGTLTAAASGKGAPDSYVYDPRDVSMAAVESQADISSLTDQRMVLAKRGRQLVYHTAPFERDTEVSGFFELSAWLAIDQPDTDFAVTIYEITPDGASIRLSTDQIRARYRESQYEPKLIKTRQPLRYDFKGFTFVSRQVSKGSRLRLVLGPLDSANYEKNFNAGGVVAEESVRDARPVTVKLFHDAAHPSSLTVPLGR